MGENFIEDLIEYLAEINELDTGTLLLDGVPFELRGYKILESEELKNNYGNRVVSNFDALYKAINKASNEFDESVIDIVAKDYNCSKSQAITKLALAWNIRAKQGKGKWFEKQSNVLSNNKSKKASLDKDKYPLLYKQMTGRNKKYYDFILELFQTRIEASGLFYLGGDKPLVASASFRFMAKSPILGSRIDTVEKNINNLARYGLIKKLTDEELMDIDTNQYEKVMKLKANNGNTINSFMLVEWTDEVLAAAEEHIAYGKNHGITNKSQNNATLSAHGYDIINKGTDSLNPEDTEDYAKLEKWARNKFRSNNAVITNKEFERKFYEIDADKTFGNDRSYKMNRLRAMLIAKLDLIQVMASKANRELFGGVNSKKFQDIAPNSKMLVKRTRYEELTKQ
jgi:hypothetical protein